MDRNNKIKAILNALKDESNRYPDVESVEYRADGRVLSDVLDYIDVDGVVHLIGGTGYDSLNIPLDALTDDSLDELYEVLVLD